MVVDNIYKGEWIVIKRKRCLTDINNLLYGHQCLQAS